jgi:hypothetical protein
MLRKHSNKTTHRLNRKTQITDQTRTNLDVPKVNPIHMLKDYPEVPATATKDYTCDLNKHKHAKPQMTWSIIKSLNPKEDQTVETLTSERRPQFR